MKPLSFSSTSLVLSLAVLCGLPLSSLQGQTAQGQSVTEQGAVTEQGNSPEVRPEAQADQEKHTQLIRSLLLRLDSLDEKSRLEAGVALREFVRAADIPLLIQTLKAGNNEDKQVFLIECLGALKAGEALEALRFELENGQLATQHAAIDALGVIRDDWAIPVLMRVLKTENSTSHKRAVSALARIGSPRALYALKSIQRGFDPPVQRSVRWATGKMEGSYPDDGIDTELPAGRRVELNFKGTRYLLYYPALRRRADLKSRMIVCIHDLNLDADSVFDECLTLAKRNQVGLLVPFFDSMNFPEYESFNIRGLRSDKRLLDILDHVSQYADLSVKELLLYGGGAGGNFVQRFALVYPSRVGRAVISGNRYLLPNQLDLYPLGMKTTPLAPDLQFDPLGFSKSDIAILVDEMRDRTEKDARKLFTAMEEFALKNGSTSRLIVRRALAQGATNMMDEVDKYLFKRT